MWPETLGYFLTKLQNLNYKTSGSACLKRLAILKFHHQLFLSRTLSRLSSPPVNNPSCPGLSEEIPHKYPPCFSKRPSSGTVSGADTTPTNGKENSYRETVTPGRLVGRKRSEQFCSPTFGSFWTQNFLVDFCRFLHLWQKYNSVSSSSSRSVKLRKQS